MRGRRALATQFSRGASTRCAWAQKDAISCAGKDFNAARCCYLVQSVCNPIKNVP
jgi:hypothetical protein